MLCTHKTTILCQFGLFVTSLPTCISINSQPFPVGIVSPPSDSWNTNSFPDGLVMTNFRRELLYEMWYQYQTRRRLSMFVIVLGSYQTVPYPGRSPMRLVRQLPVLQWILIPSGVLRMFFNRSGLQKISTVD